MRYYWESEKQHGSFTAETDETACSQAKKIDQLRVLYREDATPDGKPFVILWTDVTSMTNKNIKGVVCEHCAKRLVADVKSGEELIQYATRIGWSCMFMTLCPECEHEARADDLTYPE